VQIVESFVQCSNCFKNPTFSNQHIITCKRSLRASLSFGYTQCKPNLTCGRDLLKAGEPGSRGAGDKIPTAPGKCRCNVHIMHPPWKSVFSHFKLRKVSEAF